MEDRCLKRVKEASGLSVFLMEELGDARLRCNQLKDYINEATSLIEKSDQREHFFEVAGHLLHGIPDTLMRMDKALSAAAMAVAKWDYEEIKEDLRPEKAEQLEDALRDVRVRRVKRKSKEASMKIQEAAEQLNQIVASTKETGKVDVQSLSQLIAALEGNSVRSASSNTDVVAVLGSLAEGLAKTEGRPSRLTLASALRRVLADTMEVKADAGALEAEEPYNMGHGLEYVRTTALTAYRRGSAGQMRVAFDLLAGIISEIGLMCDSLGDNSAAGLAIRLSKAVRLARRHLKPDVIDNMVLAAEEGKEDDLEGKPWDHFDKQEKLAGEEKESRFEEGKPADPTENMSEEDAAKWKTEHAENKDNFKSATEDKESRFEEGKPADPTENMSKEDAAKWKTEHAENKDNFKSAKEECRKSLGKTEDGWPVVCNKPKGHSGSHDHFEKKASEFKKEAFEMDSDKFERVVLPKMKNVKTPKQYYAAIEDLFGDHKITQQEFRWLEEDAENFEEMIESYKKNASDPWKV